MGNSFRPPIALAPRGVVSTREAGHVRSSIVLHGRVAVVSSTAQLDPVGRVPLRPGPGIQVVELEEVARTAATTVRSDERTPTVVSGTDGSLDVRRKVPGGGCALPRSVRTPSTRRLREPLPLRVLDQQCERSPEDLCHVAVGKLVTEQRLRLTEPVAKRLASGELDPEPPATERARSRSRHT